MNELCKIGTHVRENMSTMREGSSESSLSEFYSGSTGSHKNESRRVGQTLGSKRAGDQDDESFNNLLQSKCVCYQGGLLLLGQLLLRVYSTWVRLYYINVREGRGSHYHDDHMDIPHALQSQFQSPTPSNPSNPNVVRMGSSL